MSKAISSTNQTYISFERINQTHTIIYLLGFAGILLVFALGEILENCCKNSWKVFCCCCYNKKDYEDKLLQSFSNNFYRELGVEDLKNEYKKTKMERDDVKKMVQGHLIPNTEGTRHFQVRIDQKLKTIKDLLILNMKQEGIGYASETIEGFNRLFKMKKNDNSHRLKTTYSYDIREDVMYKRVTKIEKRMRKFYA